MRYRYLKFIVLMFLLAVAPFFSIEKAMALAPAVNWVLIPPPTTSVNYGISGAMHCDLDGDRIKDVVVTDYRATDPGTGLTQSGRVDIYWGGATLSVVPDIQFYGEGDSRFGDGVSCGDFNGDGIDDLSVGAVKYTVFTGRNYLFYGRSRADWALVDHSVDANVIVRGEANNSHLGNKSAIGDINGDGKGDLLIGSEYAETNRGRAYVIFGRTDNYLEMYAYDADIIFNNDFPADVSALGDDVSIGDVSADGIPDILISVGDWLDGDGGGQSRAIAFYGSPSITTGTVNASTANTIILANGEADFNGFGYAIREGDVNGDGKGDLVVGADHFISAAGNPRLSIFYGPIPTGTVNVADSANQVFVSERTNDLFSMEIQTGDVNNDGIDDIVTSAAYYNLLTRSGRLYVFLGGSGLAGKTQAAEADYIVNNASTSGYMGWWVTVGDVNGDGWDEFGSGATGALPGKFCIFAISHIAPTVTVTSAASFSYGAPAQLQGTATDPDSGNIASVQYSLDDGSWQPATADDGSFNSPTENYSIILSGLASGSHTVRVRATDSENATTAVYASATFSIDPPASLLTTLPETGADFF